MKCSDRIRCLQYQGRCRNCPQHNEGALVADRITIDQPSEKSATNPLSLKERVEKHPFHYLIVTAASVAVAVALGISWLSEKYRVEPKLEKIASLEQKISELNTARDPDRTQINQLSAKNQKLENDLGIANDNLKQSRDDLARWKNQNAELQKRINTYATN